MVLTFTSPSTIFFSIKSTSNFLSSVCNPTPISLYQVKSIKYTTHSTQLKNQPCCVDSPARSTYTSSPSCLTIDPNTSALRDGILLIAIGKNGSKSLPSDLIIRISKELNQLSKLSSIPIALTWQRASFLGALYMKSPRTNDEQILLATACGKIGNDHITPSNVIPAAEGSNDDSTSYKFIKLGGFAERLLAKEFLNITEAENLGRLLYCIDENEPPAIAALIAHVMRVRHETGTELAGLARAVNKNTKKLWKNEDNVDKRFLRAHIAEPFDGTMTWDLLTPLICKYLKENYGIQSVMGVGRSGGPKMGCNLLDVTRSLGLRPCKNVDDLLKAWDSNDRFGAVVSQEDCNIGLDKWINMRRMIGKRPSIATVEKYGDVCLPQAELFIASAFHNSYIEKMAETAEGVGYESYIIIGKGMEGTIGVGIGEKRKTKMMIGWKDEEGYKREEIEFNVIKEGMKFEDELKMMEPKKGSIDAGENAMKIRRYWKDGKSGDRMFDCRVKMTMKVLEKGMRVLKKNNKMI